MEFALKLSVDSVVLKGDSEFLMKALVEEGISLLSYGLLIADVKVLSRSFFFNYIWRGKNMVWRTFVKLGLMDLVHGSTEGKPMVQQKP